MVVFASVNQSADSLVMVLYLCKNVQKNNHEALLKLCFWITYAKL